MASSVRWSNIIRMGCCMRQSKKEKMSTKTEVLITMRDICKKLAVIAFLFAVAAVFISPARVQAIEYLADAAIAAPVQLQLSSAGGQTIGMTPAPILEFRQMAAYEIFDRFTDAVFTIYVSFDGITFEGESSGFIVDPSGIAVTAWHCLGAPFMRARMQDGTFHNIIGVYNYDITNDLAVIRLEGSNFPSVILGDSDSVRPGQSLVIIGTPWGQFHNSITTGIVRGFGNFTLDRLGINITDAIMTDAATFGGNSGGPVFNNLGQVIGVLVGGWEVDGVPVLINYVSPINRINLSPQGLSNLTSLAAPVAPADRIVIVETEITVSRYSLVGYWLWAGGYYHFNVDGTGSRDWVGASGDFTWRIEGADDLVIEQRGNVERWTVNVLNINSMIITNALFTRVEKAAALTASPVVNELVGEWLWSGGVYHFYDDAFGWRDWGVSPGYFIWMATDYFISIAPIEIVGNTVIHEGGAEIWSLDILDTTNIIIGGAHMVRYGTEVVAPQDLAALLMGFWWYEGDYNLAFLESNFGFNDWILPDGTYEYVPFEWRVADNLLFLEFDIGYAVAEIIVINIDTVLLTFDDGLRLLLYRLY